MYEGFAVIKGVTRRTERPYIKHFDDQLSQCKKKYKNTEKNIETVSKTKIKHKYNTNA